MKKAWCALFLLVSFVVGSQVTNYTRYLSHPPSGEIRMFYRDDKSMVSMPFSLDLTNVIIKAKSDWQVFLSAHHSEFRDGEIVWTIEFVK